MDDQSPPNPFAPPTARPVDPEPPEIPRLPGEPITISEGGLWVLAPFYLLFRPGFFFRRFGVACPVVLGILLLWVFGVVSTIDRIDLKTASGSAQFSQLGILDNWETYWGFALGASICATAGLAFFRVGWYWLRLMMCGVKSPQYGVALNLFAFSASINAAPTLVAAIVSTVVYATPRDAQYAAEWWWMVVGAFALLSLYWSTWTSYRGVRSVYEPRVWSARMWFLILPWTVQTIAAGAVIFVSWFLSTTTPPDLDAPVTHDGVMFDVEYPANWELNADAEAIEQGAMITISPIYQDAYIRFQVYEPTESLEDELDLAADTFADQTEFTITQREDIERIGPWEGAGRRYDASHPEGEYIYDLLSVRVTEWYNVDISLLYLAEDEPVIRAGFDHVLDSLKVTTPDRVDADVANGYYVSSGAFRVLVPGNWSWVESAEGSADPADLVRRLDIYPHADGVLRLMEYAWGGTAEEAVQSTIDFRVGEGEELARAPLKSWGPFEGEGVVIRYRAANGTDYRMRVVIKEIGEGIFREVQLIAADGASEVIDPGYMFIEKTLEVE